MSIGLKGSKIDTSIWDFMIAIAVASEGRAEGFKGEETRICMLDEST